MTVLTDFLVALTFLTRLGRARITTSGAISRSMPMYPLVGAVIGLILALTSLLPLSSWTLDDGRNDAGVSTYADLAPGQIGLLAGSQGVMELAVNGGSCAGLLGLAPGRTLRLTCTDPRS